VGSVPSVTLLSKDNLQRQTLWLCHKVCRSWPCITTNTTTVTPLLLAPNHTHPGPGPAPAHISPLAQPSSFSPAHPPFASGFRSLPHTPQTNHTPTPHAQGLDVHSASPLLIHLPTRPTSLSSPTFRLCLLVLPPPPHTHPRAWSVPTWASSLSWACCTPSSSPTS